MDIDFDGVCVHKIDNIVHETRRDFRNVKSIKKIGAGRQDFNGTQYSNEIMKKER
jgi:hypothetical protein